MYSIYKSSLEVWKHCLRDQDGLTAKCKRCAKILKTKDHSTKGLHTPLKSIHQIDTKKSVEVEMQANDGAPGPSTSNSSASEPAPAENTLQQEQPLPLTAPSSKSTKKRKITDHFIVKIIQRR